IGRVGVRPPFLAVSPILGAKLVTLEGRAFAFLEAAELLLLADREPELGEDQAVARQVFLEIVDLAIGAKPVVLLGEALNALDQHAAIPGSVEDRDMAAARNLAPEPPEIGMRALLVGRRRDRHDAEEPRVEPADYAPDRPALAGGVGSLKHDDSRAPPEALAARELVQPALQVREPRFVFAQIELGRKIERVEQAPAIDRRDWWRRGDGDEFARAGEALLERRRESLGRGQDAEFRVRRGHDRPGGVGMVGHADRVAPRGRDLLVMLVLFPVGLG